MTSPRRGLLTAPPPAPFRWRHPLGWRAVLVLLAHWYTISCFPGGHGGSSFSNRYFLSLTPLFVIGLACSLESAARWWESRSPERSSLARTALVGGIALLALWNAGFIFQWGANIVPNRGPVSFREVARNQITVVPGRIMTMIGPFLFDRRALIEQVEREDLKETESPEQRRGFCHP